MEVSDSNTDESEELSDGESSDLPEAGPSENHTNGHYHADDDFEDHHSSDDGEDGPAANETEFPHELLRQEDLNLNRRNRARDENLFHTDVNLEDDGKSVSRQQWKMWEEWVVKRR